MFGDLKLELGRNSLLITFTMSILAQFCIYCANVAQLYFILLTSLFFLN
jgi:hypothetical protein